MNEAMHIRLAWAGAALGVVLVIGQAFFTIPLRMAEGGGFLFALVFYLSFLSVWANLLAVLVYAGFASARPGLRSVSGPTGRTLAAGPMLFLLFGHAMGLLPMPGAQGLGRVFDIGLHYLAPALFLFWWLNGPHPVPLRWNRAYVMMALPLGYVAWVVGRGLAIDRWPYPFLSLPDLGWGGMLVNIVGFAVAFAVAFLGLIAVSRKLYRKNRWGKIGG